MSDDKEISVRSVDAICGTPKRSTQFKVFRYKAPENLQRARALIPLAKTETLLSMVQIIRGKGGEQELHLHTAMDGFWFVLAGCARFYTEDDVLVAELARHEGILVPSGAKYWFESQGTEQLELLQVEAIDHRSKNEVRYFSERQRSVVSVHEPDGKVIAGAVRLGGSETSDR